MRSNLEKKAFRMFDLSSAVVCWGSESLVIEYFNPVDGRMHRYFPDLIVRYTTEDGDKIAIIEIKPYKQTQKPERGRMRVKTYMREVQTYITNMAKWNAAARWCEKQNRTKGGPICEFRLMTEKQLGTK